MAAKPQYVARDVREIVTLWPELIDHPERLRHRPYAQQQPNAERQKTIDALIRQERRDRYDPRFTGRVASVADPVNWTRFVAMLDGADAILELEDEIREKIGDNTRTLLRKSVRRGNRAWHGPQRFWPIDVVFALPGTYEPVTLNVTIGLRYLSTAVFRVRDGDLLAHASGEIADVLRTVRSALGDPPRARWMPDARCPYCCQLSMFVFDPRADDRDKEKVHNEQPTIRCCTNRRGDEETGRKPIAECLCPGGRDGYCAQNCDLGGRHSWPQDEWPRVAEILYRGVKT